jgi:hypothetical protein
MPVMERPSAIGPAPAAQMPPSQGYSGIMQSPASVQGHSGLMQSPASAMMTTPMQGQSGIMQSPASAVGVPAVSQGSIPPPPRSNTIASSPQPELPSHVAGNPAANVGPTHVSAQRPPGTPSVHGTTPVIEVVDPPPRPERTAPYWVVGLVAFVAFGLGLAVGILIG